MKNLQRYHNQLINQEIKYSELSQGLKVLLLAHETSSRDYPGQGLIISDIVWSNQYESLVQELELAGIGEFVIADKSTALMELLHYLLSQGYSITNNVTIIKEESNIWDQPLPGLQIRRNK